MFAAPAPHIERLTPASAVHAAPAPKAEHTVPVSRTLVAESVCHLRPCAQHPPRCTLQQHLWLSTSCLCLQSLAVPAAVPECIDLPLQSSSLQQRMGSNTLRQLLLYALDQHLWHRAPRQLFTVQSAPAPVLECIAPTFVATLQQHTGSSTRCQHSLGGYHVSQRGSSARLCLTIDAGK